MKSKTIRVNTEDAFIIEQAARELSAKIKRDVSVGELFNELIESVEVAKGEVEKKASL